MSPIQNDELDDRQAPEGFDAWAADVRDDHASDTEFQELLGSYDKLRSIRATAHLQTCAMCREELAALIEKRVIHEQSAVDDLGLYEPFLNHEEPMVRAAAVRVAITLHEDVPAVAQMIEPLLSDQDGVVRADAIATRARLPEAPVRQLVALLSDATAPVRVAAAAALKALDPVALISHLAGFLSAALRAAETGRSLLPSSGELPSYVSFEAGRAEQTVDVTPPPRVITDEHSLSVVTFHEDKSGSLHLRIGFRNPALEGTRIELSAGPWHHTQGLTASPTMTGGGSPESVTADFVLSAAERQHIGVNRPMTVRVLGPSSEDPSA
jgi:hypothetical protein